MLTKLNFTGRMKILREDVTVRYLDRPGVQLQVQVRLDLAEYGVPPDALVFLEAYHRTEWHRWDMGTVAELRPERTFDFPPGLEKEGILFRVRVVKPLGQDRMLLCEAEGLKGMEGELPEGAPQPILPVRREDLGELVWRLGTDEPELIVNKHLGSQWREIARSELFQTLVYPEAMRQALRWAVKAVESDSEGDDSTARRWIRFAEAIPGVPALSDFSDDDEQCERWVDEAVSAFCRNKRLCGRFMDACNLRDADT